MWHIKVWVGIVKGYVTWWPEWERERRSDGGKWVHFGVINSAQVPPSYTVEAEGGLEGNRTREGGKCGGKSV